MKRALILLLLAAASAQAQQATPVSLDRVLAMLGQGRVAEAGTQLQRYRQLHPEDREALRLQLSLWLDGGQREQAKALLEAELGQRPGQLDLARQLARLQAESGEFRPAVQTLNRALGAQVAPADLAFRAALLSGAGEPAEALSNWEAACLADPGQGAWWVALGDARAQAGDRPGATSAYRAALASKQLEAERVRQVQQKLRQSARR